MKMEVCKCLIRNIEFIYYTELYFFADFSLCQL